MYKQIGGGITKLKKNKISKFLLGDLTIEANASTIILSKRNAVNLNAWISPDNSVQNIGDYLSYIVVSKMCEYFGIDFNKRTSKTKHLYAIGSILIGYQNSVVWGSGFGYLRSNSPLYKIDNFVHKVRHTVDVRAVRGPLSREILMGMGYDCPKIYGDPAVLLPLFYKKERTHERSYIIIPHYSMLSEEKYKNNPNVLGSFRNDWKDFVDIILQSDLVISSSLHGIIIAESYGVPAIMLKDVPASDITKYRDWYLSTGRTAFPIAASVEDALSMAPTVLDRRVLKKCKMT